MTRDEQLIRAALEMAAKIIDAEADSWSEVGNDSERVVWEARASAIRAIYVDEVLAEIPTEWPAPMPITMTYRNWRGETSERTIIPSRIWFGQTEWHPDLGWMLSAFDLGKRAHRDFALADCQFKTENK